MKEFNIKKIYSSLDSNNYLLNLLIDPYGYLSKIVDEVINVSDIIEGQKLRWKLQNLFNINIHERSSLSSIKEMIQNECKVGKLPMEGMKLIAEIDTLLKIKRK